MISKPYENNYFEDAESAYEHIKKNDNSYPIIINLYSISNKIMNKELKRLYNYINESKYKITNEYPFRTIIGCLEVMVCECQININF